MLNPNPFMVRGKGSALAPGAFDWLELAHASPQSLQRAGLLDVRAD